MRGRVVVLLNVEPNHGEANQEKPSLGLLLARAGALRVVTEIYRHKEDGSNFWGWKFFSDSRQIVQNSGSNLFMEFSPSTFSKFSDQLIQHGTTSRRSSRYSQQQRVAAPPPGRVDSGGRVALVKALTDIVTQYPWDMPDITSPVRRRSRKDLAPDGVTAGRSGGATAEAPATNIIYVFTDQPATCQAWARYHGSRSSADGDGGGRISAEDVHRLEQEELLPASLMSYLERHSIQLVFVDVATGCQRLPHSSKEEATCHGLCQRFAQCLGGELSGRATSISLLDLLYSGLCTHNGVPRSATSSASSVSVDASVFKRRSCVQSTDVASLPAQDGAGLGQESWLQYEEVSLCRLHISPYTVDSSSSSISGGGVSIRVIGMVRQADMALAPMSMFTCIGLSTETDSPSVTFQELMKLLGATEFSLAVSVYPADQLQPLLGIMHPLTSSIALLCLCDNSNNNNNSGGGNPSSVAGSESSASSWPPVEDPRAQPTAAASHSRHRSSSRRNTERDKLARRSWPHLAVERPVVISTSAVSTRAERTTVDDSQRQLSACASALSSSSPPPPPLPSSVRKYNRRSAPSTVPLPSSSSPLPRRQFPRRQSPRIQALVRPSSSFVASVDDCYSNCRRDDDSRTKAATDTGKRKDQDAKTAADDPTAVLNLTDTDCMTSPEFHASSPHPTALGRTLLRDALQFQLPPSLLDVMSETEAGKYQCIADRHCRLLTGQAGVESDCDEDQDHGDVEAKTRGMAAAAAAACEDSIPLDMFSLLSMLSPWTNAYPRPVSRTSGHHPTAAGSGSSVHRVSPATAAKNQCFDSLLAGLDRTPADSLVESDVNANLQDLCRNMIAGTSPSLSSSSSAVRRTRSGRLAGSHASSQGNGGRRRSCDTTNTQPPPASVLDLISQGLLDAPLQKGVHRWLAVFIAEHKPEDYDSAVQCLTKEQLWHSPKQLRSFFSETDAEQRPSWLQVQILLRFELQTIFSRPPDDGLTNELVSFLQSIGMLSGPRCLVSFMEGVLVERYVEKHTRLLLDLCEELDITPCDALGEGSGAAGTTGSDDDGGGMNEDEEGDDLFPSLLSELTAPAGVGGGGGLGIGDAFHRDLTQQEDTGKPTLKRYPTEDLSRRQISVPARKKTRKNSSRSSKVAQADLELASRIRGRSDSQAPTLSQSDQLRGKGGVRRQLFSSSAAPGRTASSTVSASLQFPPLKSSMKKMATSSSSLFSGNGGDASAGAGGSMSALDGFSVLSTSSSLSTSGPVFDDDRGAVSGNGGSGSRAHVSYLFSPDRTTGAAVPRSMSTGAGDALLDTDRTLVEDSPAKRTRLQLAAGGRRTAFSVEDTPIKNQASNKQRTLELRRRLSKGKVSIAETPPKKSFYSTSESKRSRSLLLRRSKTVSHLLSSSGEDPRRSPTASVSQLDESNTSLSSLPDPFSPTTTTATTSTAVTGKKRKHSSVADPAMVAVCSARRVRPRLMQRFRSEGCATTVAAAKFNRSASTLDTSPELLSETLLTDEDDDDDAIVESSPNRIPSAAGTTLGVAPVASSPSLSLLATPHIEGIDQLLTSPLVSNSSSNQPTPTSFFH